MGKKNKQISYLDRIDKALAKSLQTAPVPTIPQLVDIRRLRFLVRVCIELQKILKSTDGFSNFVFLT